MPAYSFKKEFVPFLKDKSKKHTIRKRRKRPARKGDKIYLYWGMRTRHCQKIAEEICQDCVTIAITRDNIYLFAARLSDFDADTFAQILQHDVVFYSDRCSYCKVPFRRLSADECDELAWSDGFRWPDRENHVTGCFRLMRNYWIKELPAVRDIVYW
jgi:hypothetical protein